MGQINHKVFRPMDLVFYREASLFGYKRKIGFVVQIFEDMFVVEATNSGMDLRHIEELDIYEARRSWHFDSSNAAYIGQSILLNDLGREKTGTKDSQYQIASRMPHKEFSAHYATIILMLSGVGFPKGATDNATTKDILSRKYGLQKIYFKEE